MIKGTKIYLEALNQNHTQAVLDLETRNKDFFEPFTVSRESDFYTLKSIQVRLEKKEKDREEDKGYEFGIFLNDGKLVGEIGLFKIERGPAERGMVGYSLDKEQNGKGYTTEALKLIVTYAFNELNLHRIEAGVMPHNVGSIRVLEKAGFHKEGIARKNVKINGRWEDHQIVAIINPED
ncbi:GNAT family N-acetyltransferase [Virgibacillus flavescens]|uniref:GNAT family N-acetyltransferase n=1 Tax=Virgibacillus flavescens TaxID=1611422 RepID=UPI003D32D465